MLNNIKHKPPPAPDKVEEVKKSDPYISYEKKDLIRCRSNTSNLAQSKIEVMKKQAMEKYPKVSINVQGIQIPSLLDSGSEVTLHLHSYFEQYLLTKPVIGERAEAQSLFRLTVMNHE